MARGTKATPAKKRKKPVEHKSAPVIATAPRRLKRPQYKTLRLSKRIKHPVGIPSIWRLTKKTARILWQHKKLFIGISLIYGLLNLLLVNGLSGGINLTELKASLEDALNGGGAVASSLTIFAVLVSSAGSNNGGSGSVYQLFLMLIVSLALIWALRETLGGMRIRVRDAYYRGMYPLVPFVLVLIVIGLQLIPFAAGAAVYNVVIGNGIAVYAAEKMLWALLFGLMALLSVYMVSSSIFALYIVTLPDMTPMRALRSARELVRYRRWTVLRKVLILPVILLIVTAIIMLPVILFVTVAAQWVFYALTMFGVAAVHTYLYNLYRELLHEQN